MAESAVNFLLEKLISLFEQEAKLLSGVRREIEDVKYELESMRAFLRNADARGESDHGVKAWVKQVKEVAYDTEDVLDEFTLRFTRPPHPHGSICKLLHKAVCLIRRLKARHQIGTQIQDIKTRVHSIKQRSDTYRFNNSSDHQGSSSRTRDDTWHDPRAASLFIDESDVVGIDKPKREIIDGLMLDGESRRTVVSVVGMGGSGKTTLIKKVYDDERVRLLFECRVWITVSESYTPEELLQNMISQICDAIKEPIPEGMDTMQQSQLMGKLNEKLQKKRYAIVFDDVWSINLWECIGSVLPDSNCGSRLMVTTRNQDVASFVVGSSGHIYNLQPLPSNEAWKLFCKRAFPSNNCPNELKELSLNILRRCEGLPLAIVAIGGLLSTKDKTLLEWKNLLDSLGSELERNPNLTSLSRILSLSYNDLPYYLKSCFLYLGFFPEDHLISPRRLIRLWIAEGFVKKEEGKTPEDVAEGYLNELIHRSLIQIGEIDGSERITGCRVHDIFREIILSKFKEDNFNAVFTNEQNNICCEKIRRLSIQIHEAKIVPQDINSSRLRSFIVFGSNDLNPPNSSLSTFFSGSRLLRVLDLEGVPLESFPDEFTAQFHLRFLSLRKTKIKTLPKCLGKLQNLETLDLKQTFVSELPSEILKLHQLRHLLVYRYQAIGSMSGMRVPAGIGSLKALQKLACIDAERATSNVIRELGNLTQLRRLSVIKVTREDGINLCSAIGKMCSLRSFSMDSISMDEVIDLDDSLSSPPQFLQRLCIEGHLEKLPHWIASLQSLVKLRLGRSRLQDDPIRILQALPNLVRLDLLNNAYDGEELCFEAGGFQKLERLVINGLEGLKSMRVEEGALPNLKDLRIYRCGVLGKVPLGIKHLVNLKELQLFDMPEEFVKKLRRDDNSKDHQRIQHIPLVRHIETENWMVENLS